MTFCLTHILHFFMLMDNLRNKDMEKIAIHRSYANTPDGQIHYATAGQGKPVLLLHQTPRSWDEYRDVLPIIGRRYRAIQRTLAAKNAVLPQ
jgi:hypothetical protein